MAKSDASYVRLAGHLAFGILADLPSGFTISGYDVKRFPESSGQQRAVRALLKSGKLEACSRAEFDDAHPEASAKGGVVDSSQEHQVQDAARARREKIEAHRASAAADAAADDEDDDEEDEDEVEIDDDSDADDEEDDDEDDSGTSEPPAPVKKAAPAKKTAPAKKAAAASKK